jgi:hypothetical protein
VLLGQLSQRRCEQCRVQACVEEAQRICEQVLLPSGSRQGKWLSMLTVGISADVFLSAGQFEAAQEAYSAAGAGTHTHSPLPVGPVRDGM